MKDAAKTPDNRPIKDYLTEVHRALYAAAELKNDLLHARPAQSQRPSNHRQELLIDEEWIDSQSRISTRSLRQAIA